MRVRLLGENLIAFRVTSGQGRAHPEPLPAPRRVALLRPQRGGGPALRLPRVEVRLRGRVRRHAERAGGEHLQGEDPGHGVSVRRSGTASSGPTWGRDQTPPPLPDIEPNMLPSGRVVIQKVAARVQLVPGPRGRHRHEPPRASCTSGSVKPESRRPGTFDYYIVADRAPKYEVVDTEFGTSYGAYRPAEAGHVLLAHRPLPVSRSSR